MITARMCSVSSGQTSTRMPGIRVARAKAECPVPGTPELLERVLGVMLRALRCRVGMYGHHASPPPHGPQGHHGAAGHTLFAFPAYFKICYGMACRSGG